jgi:histidinol-phosphate/aromatic aminotransferase/cobyric acid decarboxylase-like protein
VSLPAQIAAAKALEDPAYYALQYEETHALRRQLIELLQPLNWEIIAGVTNFILCHLPEKGPDAVILIARCRERGLFLRDVSAMGAQLGDRAVRLAVKDAATNQRMVKIIREAWDARV